MFTDGASLQVVAGSTVGGSVVALNSTTIPRPGGALTQLVVCGTAIGGSVLAQNASGAGPIDIGGPLCAPRTEAATPSKAT